jgi:hypothetical protein
MSKPTKSEIRGAVESVLKLVMKTSGRHCPPLTDTTKPVGDLEEFDSLLGLEATVALEQVLDCKLADGSAFVVEAASGKKVALSIAQAVDRVAVMIVESRAA